MNSNLEPEISTVSVQRQVSESIRREAADELGGSLRGMSEADEFLEMSEEALADARIEEASERASWSSLYYSAFYAAKAVLLSPGYEPQTHTGTDNLVGKILYKDEEVIDVDQASFYSNLRRIKEEAEYEPKAVVHDDIEDSIRKAGALVSDLREVVESEEQ